MENSKDKLEFKIYEIYDKGYLAGKNDGFKEALKEIRKYLNKLENQPNE